jgi:RHS repeat-associated protein
VHRRNPKAERGSASRSSFTGKEEDVEVGLQYFGKRFYAPLLNRWISPDPLAIHGLGADLNLYAYVRGTPLKATDPLGLEDEPETVPEPPVTQASSEKQGGTTVITMDEMVVSNTGRLSVPKEAPASPDTWHPPLQTCPGGCHGYTGVVDPATGLTAYGQHGGVPIQGNVDPLLPVKIAYNVAGNLAKGWMPFYAGMPELGDALVPRASYAPGSERLGGTLEFAGTLGAPLATKWMAPGEGAGGFRGSGPAPGVLEVSDYRPSTEAFRAYQPAKPIEYVFDPVSERFAVGAAPSGGGSPHQRLAGTINADPNDVVGGMFQRGPGGEIQLNEHSGHYWQNWSPGVRSQLQQFLESRTQQQVLHSEF